MKRNAVNFWVDALALASFLVSVSTGALLRGFPDGPAEGILLGFPRGEWGDLHWVVSLLFVVLVAAHFLLHWGWVKANAGKRLGLGPRLLGVVLAVGFVVSCIALPAWLTRDMDVSGSGTGQELHRVQRSAASTEHR